VFPKSCKESKNRSLQLLTQNTEQDKFIGLKIKIIDTGAGISKEGMKKLFMDFGKLDENAHLNREGTGLGLSICKSIIEQ